MFLTVLSYNVVTSGKLNYLRDLLSWISWHFKVTVRNIIMFNVLRHYICKYESSFPFVAPWLLNKSIYLLDEPPN